MPVRGGAGLLAALLETGQITAYSFFDDGSYEAGVAKAYTVNALAGNTDIEVAHYAAATLSFTAPGTIADAANGLAGWAVNDRMVIKGSASNDGEVTVTGIGGAPANLTISAAVNELAGAMISLYKVAAHSNNVVTDTNTGRMWSRNTSTGEAVGLTSNGLLNWYDVATDCAIYAGANTISDIMPDSIFRVIGGAALTQFHEGDCIMAAGFVNGVNNLPNAYVVSATPNGADLDVVVDPGPETLIAEGAVGDALYLNTRSCFNYAAGARLAALSNLTDWRIPNIKEVLSLMDEEAPTGFPDVIAFPAWANYIDGSTSQPSNTGQRLLGAFNLGTIANTNKATNNLCVTALVRLGI